MAYPVTFDIERPQNFDRVQLALRVLIAIIVFGVLGWAIQLLYLAVPVVAAVLISQKGARKYLDESENNIGTWMRFLIAFFSYVFLLTDKLPTDNPKQIVRFEYHPDGEPTVGGVLVRIITAIPHLIVLGILTIVAGILWIIAAIMVLVQESYPEGIYNFQRGYMRWNVRMYGYLAGLAQAYPPFALDTGSEGAAPATPAASGPPA